MAATHAQIEVDNVAVDEEIAPLLQSLWHAA